jgi:poly(3-hydroxybutyrate) depolymerase
MNAGEIIKQWTEVHGFTLYPTEAGASRRGQHRVWRGPDGAPLLESHSISGMGHAVPVAPGDTPQSFGLAGPFADDVGISSSFAIANFWGLTEAAQEVEASNSQTTPVGAKLKRTLPFGS